MGAPRFYIRPEDWTTNVPILAGAEAHHARDVLRLRDGDQVALFDGHGHELTAEISEIGRREIRFSVLQEREAPPRVCRITLAQAVPKGKNMDLIVQKAGELGAAEIVPIISERTVVSLNEKERQSKQAKWQQIVIEACKQCGQNWMPDVAEPRSLKEFFQARTSAVSGQKSELSLIASTQADALHLKEILTRFETEHEARPARVTILIGPEGDFTPAEYGNAAEAGFQAITLGPIILRVETAAIFCLSVLSYELLGEAE